MSHELSIRTTLAIVAATAIAIGGTATARAFDDDSRGKQGAIAKPVVRDGRPVATEIVPPSASAAQRAPASAPRAAPAVQRATQTTDEPEQGPGDAVQPGTANNNDVVAASPYPRPRFGGLRGNYRHDRRFLHYPRYRGYDAWGYGYGAYDHRAIRDAYDAGRDDERTDVQRRFNEDDTDQRRERVLSAHDEALDRGLAHLLAGDNREAAAALTLAARLDQGDPACRVHLAQARLALGQYDDAGKVLRRGLELQPELALMPLDLARAYPAAADFDAHVTALSNAVKAQRTGADGIFLLAFLEYQRGQTDAAHQHFVQLTKGKGRDLLVRDLLDVTKPATR